MVACACHRAGSILSVQNIFCWNVFVVLVKNFIEQQNIREEEQRIKIIVQKMMNGQGLPTMRSWIFYFYPIFIQLKAKEQIRDGQKIIFSNWNIHFLLQGKSISLVILFFTKYAFQISMAIWWKLYVSIIYQMIILFCSYNKKIFDKL